MKKLIYIIPMLLLAAACAKEPAEQEQEAKKVPLNITITTKAGGNGSGDEATYDVNSIRVAVFKKLGGAASSDLVVVNEYYPNGFDIIGSENGQTDNYTVAVRPVLELDQNTDDYYVYVVLNESGYILKGGDDLSTELNALADRSEMDALLATPAVYASPGVTEAPYCLMSASKTIHFANTPGAKDRPMDVKFNTTSGPTASQDEALRRNMAQITVEGIESIATDTYAAELPKIFVLDVKLVNVPSDMTWSAAPGSTAGGKVTLPIGEANAKGFYDRNWDGSVYRDVNVTMNRLDRPDNLLYRTNKDGLDGWGFTKTPFRYQNIIEDPRTDPQYTQNEPPTYTYSGVTYTLWPFQDGKKYKYYVPEYAGQNVKGIKTVETGKLQDAIKALIEGWKSDKTSTAATNAAIIAYRDYLDACEAYDDGSAQAQAIKDAYTDANASLKKIGTKSPDSSVSSLISALASVFNSTDHDFWENTTTNSEVTGISSTQTNTSAYCSLEPWNIDLGTSYYVPENISSSFNQNSTTCIYVKLAVANPAIDIKKDDYKALPAPPVESATGGAATYWLSNTYFAKSGKNYTEKTIEEFNLAQTTDDPKIHINHYTKDGKIDGYVKDDNGGVDDKGQKFNLPALFKANGHIVNADDHMIEYGKDLTGSSILTDNNYYVYIDGFYRKVTGLTGISTINQNQAGATFSWGLDTTKYKEFYIPVNNNIDGTYDIKRNTKYTVKLYVGENTYNAVTKGSASEDDFGFGVTATVTTEKLTENED